MSTLEKYSSYKDSGVEWLGEIPESWEALANKHIFTIKQTLVGEHSKDYDLLSLTLKGIIKRDMDNPKGKFPTDFDTYQEVEKDDFVFCLFDVEETPRTVGLSKYYGMITGAYTVMAVENMNINYLYYFYLNFDSSKRFKPLYKGLRNTISKDSFFSFKTFIPPKHEQTKIASFLDTKTEQLDKAIKQKEELIELLKERRQILINDAVTKGIDKTVTMKDSGIEWIGEIPEHWEVKRLKYSLQLQNKKTSIEEQQVIALENIENFTGKYIETASKYVGEDNTFQKNDILFGKLRPYLAKVFLCKCDGIAFGDLLTFRPMNNFDSKFAFYLLISAQFIKTVDSSTYGSKMPRASSSFINEMLIVVPPKEEQIKIAEYIENNNQKTDKAIDLQQQQITKLKEYKSTLIDSVITGKVRVV
ncbi:MAG: restriction endonuclease subunit S [Campylobacterota bacterium]|nr:restriction endonuclease subunit S [Campylobacterota bacterium]